MNYILPNARNLEKILRQCGNMLLECHAKGEIKGEWTGSQFKAIVDDLAHNFLLKELNEAFPGKPVISEEDPASIESCLEDHFIIDPVDGTASFVHGFSGWVTQAAYIIDGRPVLAGIYAPASDEYFSAIINQGAYCNGSRLSVDGASDILNNLIDNYPQPTGIALDLMKAFKIPNYEESGSISLKICRIADRSADIFIKDMTPRDWDIAAPMLLLAEAGGVMTDIDGAIMVLGNPQRSHRGLIATANANISEKISKWVKSRK